MIPAAVALVCALVISLGLTALLIRAAPRLGLIDLPAARKVHDQPTPRGGGLAIFASLLLTTTLLAPFEVIPSRLLILLGTGFLIVLLGLLDDYYSLPWAVRLGVQTATAVAVFGWPMQTGWLPSLLAVLWVVSLTNSFNMLDNMDALSAGVAGIAALCFALVLFLRSDATSIVPYAMLSGGVLGFLWFNRPPARIFMGDAGSTFLGFFLGVRSLQDSVANWAVPLAILAVPWYDLITVVLLRLSQGRSPFHADRQHLSHRLAARGLSFPAAVRIIHMLALVSGILGVGMILVPEQREVLGVVLIGMWLVVAVDDFWSWQRR